MAGSGFSYEQAQQQSPEDDEEFGLGGLAMPGMNPNGITSAGTKPMATTAIPPPVGGDAVSFTGASQSFQEKQQTLDTPAPAGPQPGPSGQGANIFDQSKNLARMVRQMGLSSDPRQKAVLQDQAARAMAATLKAQGHDVKWQGDQLIIDGRPYVIGDGAAAGKPGGGGMEVEAGGYTGQTAPAAPTGWPVHNTTITDGFQTAGVPPYAGGDPWQYWLQIGQGKPATPANLIAMEAQLAQAGIKVLRNAAGVAGKIQTPDGVIHDVIEKAMRGGGGAWVDQIATPGADMPGGEGGLPGGAFSYERTAPPQPVPGAEFGAPTYEPGQMPDDLGGFDMEELAGLFDVGDEVDTTGGALGGQADDLLSRLLANPHSISDLDIDKMKASSKDELADMAETDDEAMRHFGMDTGIADSNWLASERANRRGARDTAIVQGNRSIEASAAQTRKADERAATDLGQTAKQRTIDNAFASRAEQQQAKSLAADTTLRAAALNNDRAALRESIKQKATELGLQADQLQMQYTLGLMDDATRKYGIDVSADLARMKDATDRQLFAEELAFKYASMAQDDAQFGAEYGLNVEKFKSEADDRAWRRYLDSINLGGD